MHAAPVPGPIRLAYVSDCDLVDLGLTHMLAPYADRVRLVESTEAPDVVLFDPGPGGLCPRAVPARDTGATPVAWSWDLTPESIEAALAAGARGYLTKQATAKELVDALEAVQAGEVVVPDGGVAPTRPEWPGKDHGLTAREAEVLMAITRGLTNQEIAQQCYLSINSVKSYIRACYRKIGVTTRSQAVLWAVTNGLRESGSDR